MVAQEREKEREWLRVFHKRWAMERTMEQRERENEIVVWARPLGERKCRWKPPPPVEMQV